MKQKIPCPKDCPDRSYDPNCHSTCPEYLNWVKEEQIKKEKLDQYKMNNNLHESRFTANQLKAKRKFQRTKKWR